MRRHREPGIRRDESGRIYAYVRAAGKLRYKALSSRHIVGHGAPLAPRHARCATTHVPTPRESLAADIEPFLRQFAHRPTFVRERRRQLGWWAERFPHRSPSFAGDYRYPPSSGRPSNEPTPPRPAITTGRRCIHSTGAWTVPMPRIRCGMFRSSPSHRPNPAGCRTRWSIGILDAMSDQGEPVRKGQPRAAGSKAKVRCRLMAFTGMRPSEIMRYRPEHWNRVDRVLTVLTGKGGRTRTIPLTGRRRSGIARFSRHSAPVGRFSTSTVHRAFRLALARLGITGIRPYDLRHSYGTAMYQVTGDTRIVKELLGHSTRGHDRTLHARPRPGVHADRRRTLSEVEYRYGIPRVRTSDGPKAKGTAGLGRRQSRAGSTAATSLPSSPSLSPAR